MIKIFLFTVLVFFCMNSVEAAPPDDFIDSLYTEYSILGLAACAFYGDSLVWDGYFGVKNLSYTDSLVNDNTLFVLWSVSKPFTAIAFMQLWEQGLVDLDADVNDYLPYEIRNPNYPSTPITPRMILSHTSSLRAVTTVFSGEMVAGDSTYSNTEYIQEVYVPGGIWYDVNQSFHNFEPGTQFVYNLHRSQAVLAAIIEQVSTFSDSFDLHCREYIFNPLSMDQTSYLITSVDTMNTAALYAYSGGSFISPYGCYASAPWYPGALLKSDPLELSQPLIAVMQGGETGGIRILQESTVDTMLTAHYPSLDPFQGLGWVMRDDFFGRLIWGHYGSSSADFGNTSVFFCPAENSAVVFMTNYAHPDVRISVMDFLFDYVAEEMGIESNPTSVATGLSIYPNPFASSLSISFNLHDPGEVQLKVYDLSGRSVDALSAGSYTAGEHSFVWDVDPLLPDGCYLIVLDGCGEYAVRRVILIR
ncbi:hypothetical protein DRQ25_02165 [Candidatus Fermentibacteria bacterium]|nr:MAG: hypothetical protein DRQ25_02165 [Candidatus Fermentibacteria bacterium]